jgi:hypothetical protein
LLKTDLRLRRKKDSMRRAVFMRDKRREAKEDERLAQQ